MERLTQSPFGQYSLHCLVSSLISGEVLTLLLCTTMFLFIFPNTVLNVHGYCGQSVINEYANFFDGFQDFRDFANQLKDKNDPKILKLKLKILAMISLGVAHVHEIDGKNNATVRKHFATSSIFLMIRHSH